MAPAELVFHGVTDPRLSVAWADTGLQVALNLPSISCIERDRVQDQKVFLDRPYFRWRIRLSWPEGGEIAFGAVGFRQSLLGESLVTDRQHLTMVERAGLMLSGK